MAYSIANLRDDLSGILHGTSLSKVVGVNNLIERAARDVLAEIDPTETVRTEQLSSALYDQVYDYAPPVDLKGDRVIDIKPQVNRLITDRFFQFYNQEFDLNNAKFFGKDTFTIERNNYIKTIRIKKDLISPILVNEISSLTDNGTWAASNDAVNLTVNTQDFVAGGSSLQFDLDGSTTDGYLENSNFEPIDLTRDISLGVLFEWVYMPTASVVTNVVLRWGDNTTNYWESTATSAQNSTAFQNGWNLIQFAWPTATTGTPDVTAVNYSRTTINYDGVAITGFRLNHLVSQLGSIYEIQYYSKFIFRDASTGAFAETIASNNDLINLDTDSYNLLTYRTAYLASQQIQGSDASFDANFFGIEYEKQKKRYIGKYRSQVKTPQSTYYTMPSNRIFITRNA